MNITPKKEEVAAVASLLTSEDYDTPEDLAREVIRSVYALLSERDGYGVGIGLPTDDLVLPHGPWFNIGDAKRVAAEAQARGLRAFVARLYGPSSALPEDVGSVYKICECGHPKSLHGEGKIARVGCGVYNRSKEQCPCKNFLPA